MKHFHLRTLLLSSALACALPAMAQAGERPYDDRWYVGLGAGANQQDSARDTENAAFGTLSVGRFINPDWSVDVEVNYQNPKANRDEDLNFSQYGISLDARRHFRKEGRHINPYFVAGVGYQRAEEEYAVLAPDSPWQSKRSYATAKLGVGAQMDLRRVSLRGEIAARHSFDNDSIVNPGKSGFTDTLASLTIIVPMGPEPVFEAHSAPHVPPAVTQANCEHLDDDGDGLNNCVDRCPDSRAGQVVGSDGCPVPLTIDLRGVNFEFDRAELHSDARRVLDESVRILERYPDLDVEVAGHTDSIGSHAYNQGLSERRAQVVYDYLIDRGVDPSRLRGPNGYGETRPIAPNQHEDGSDNPEGRALNRRTELNVQN